jgi:calcium/calmodulin-dependent protein kinase I
MTVERFLGRGGCGEVRLERNKEDGKARAVKKITMTSPRMSNIDCEKELRALLEFSRPKVIQP